VLFKLCRLDGGRSLDDLGLAYICNAMRAPITISLIFGVFRAQGTPVAANVVVFLSSEIQSSTVIEADVAVSECTVRYPVVA